MQQEIQTFTDCLLLTIITIFLFHFFTQGDRLVISLMHTIYIKQILYKTEAMEAWYVVLHGGKEKILHQKRCLVSTISHLWIILKAAHCRMSPKLDDVVHTVTAGIQ